jgi:hypothetical protein
MVHLRKCESDLGVCAVVLCPHCQKAVPFHLREEAAAFALLGIPLFNVGSIHQLVCDNCKHSTDLEHRELSAALAAKRLYAKLESEEIDAEAYLQELKAIDFPSLQVLREASKLWRCPDCSETVPANFNDCWKCSTPRPGTENIISTEPFAAKLPRDVTKQVGIPWQGP